MYRGNMKEVKRGTRFFTRNESENALFCFQNAFEAQCLVNQLQLYFSGSDRARTGLLEKFHHKPNEFKHSELVQQLESLDLSAISPQKRDE